MAYHQLVDYTTRQLTQIACYASKTHRHTDIEINRQLSQFVDD